MRILTSAWPNNFHKLFCLATFLTLAPHSAAEVFKCVDKSTGKVSFTDQACPNDQQGESQNVRPANDDSGYETKVTSQEKDGVASQKNTSNPGWQSRKEYIKSEREERKASK